MDTHVIGMQVTHLQGQGGFVGVFAGRFWFVFMMVFWWWWFLMVILYMERNKEREENNRVSTRVNHKMSMVTVNFNCGTFRWSTKDLGDGGWWGW